MLLYICKEKEVKVMLAKVELTNEQIEAIRVTKEVVHDIADQLVDWTSELVYDDYHSSIKNHEQMMDIYRFLRELDEGVALIYDNKKMD